MTLTPGAQSTSSPQYLAVLLSTGTLSASGKPTEGDGTNPDVILSKTPTPTQFYDLRDHHLEGGMPGDTTICVLNTAGTAAVSITYCRVWLYFAAIGKMFPFGVGADADKGKINDTTIAIGVTDTDKLRHCEVIGNQLGMADGVQVEIGVTGGTGAEAFDVYLLIPRRRRVCP